MTRSSIPVVVRPPSFTFRNLKTSRDLFCDDLPLASLAQRFGTPLYVYSERTIRDRLAAFDAAFRGLSHTICYSVKANSSLAVLRMIARTGAGFDVVSGGELARVRKADPKSARRVVFSGVGKTREEMTAALKSAILLFNVESESELNLLATLAGRMQRIAPVALRVNPDVSAETHPYISTGLHQHKFGIPISQARALYRRAARSKWLRVAGVSLHIGSQITDLAPFQEAMERVAGLVRGLRADRHQIDFVDAGGGLGIPYDAAATGDFTTAVQDYADAVTAPLKGLDVHLLLEPGRAIIGPAGILLTRVLYRKENDGKRFLIVDAAMNDLLRPSLYKAHHEIAPVRLEREPPREVTDVVGPVCETGDFFARDRELPIVQEGGLLAILDAGAYGMSLSSNYNSRPRPAEVLVAGKTARLIRRRETVSDLFRLER